VAGFEPLAAPDSQRPGGGYARVEVTLLAETVGTKVSQGAAEKPPRSSKKGPPAASDHDPADKHSSQGSHNSNTHVPSAADNGNGGHDTPPQSPHSAAPKAHEDHGISRAPDGHDHASSSSATHPPSTMGRQATEKPAKRDAH
jgi:hypothetical protein